jgi:hypothetical protein
VLTHSALTHTPPAPLQPIHVHSHRPAVPAAGGIQYTSTLLLLLTPSALLNFYIPPAMLYSSSDYSYSYHHSHSI